MSFNTVYIIHYSSSIHPEDGKVVLRMVRKFWEFNPRGTQTKVVCERINDTIDKYLSLASDKMKIYNEK